MKSGLPKNHSAVGQGALAPGPPSPPKSRVSAALAALLVRRKRWTLTWTGRLLTLAVAAMLTVILARGLCGFLAITSPVSGQFLVVEGWMPAYAYREAAAQFRKGGYRKIIAAGVSQADWDAGEELREHFAGKKLIQFGVPGDLIVTASAEDVQRDRTFHAAMAVKHWLQEQGLRTTSIDVVTVGPHARRSRLLYEKALGNEVKVGVISVEDRRFDPNHWWRSSEGVRTVVDESIAYLYARVFFSTTQ
jgi:uncharacterized SAM-binding protein YcdF (DUF218 family)